MILPSVPSHFAAVLPCLPMVEEAMEEVRAVAATVAEMAVAEMAVAEMVVARVVVVKGEGMAGAKAEAEREEEKVEARVVAVMAVVTAAAAMVAARVAAMVAAMAAVMAVVTEVGTPVAEMAKGKNKWAETALLGRRSEQRLTIGWVGSMRERL